MRIAHASIVVLLLACVASATADNTNAATWYNRAFDATSRLSRAQWQVIDDWRANPVGAPPAAVRQILAQAATAMSFGRRGTTQRYSDYGLDYEQGFELTLPHLGSSRALAKLMSADALLKLYDGDVPGAADRVASIYRMGEHVGHDRIVISSLVAQSVWNLGDEAMQLMLDRGLLEAGDAAIVLEATNDLKVQDPFNYVEAVYMEQDLALASIDRYVREDEDGIVAAIDLLLPAGAGVPEEFYGWTQADVNEHLSLYSDFMTAAADAMAMNDPEGMASLEKRLATGEFGALARLFAPSMSKALEWKMESETSLAERQKMLSAMVRGEFDVKEAANAAVWYVRAGELLRKEDPAQLDALRVASDAAQPAAEALRTFIDEELGDVFQLLDEASRMKRCDFAFARSGLPPGPVAAPPYAPGLRDLVRLVLLDATRDDGAEAHERRFARLRLALVMLDHLEHDGTFTTSIMIHDAFERIAEMTLDLLRSGQLDDDRGAALVALAGQLGRVDPFGYVGAIVQAREDLVAYVAQVAPPRSAAGVERFQALERSAKSIDGDRLVYLAAIMDTMRSARAARAEGDVATNVPAATVTSGAPWAELAGLYDLDAVAKARQQVPQVAPVLGRLELDVIGAMAVPPIARIADRMREAQTDLRRAVIELRSLERNEPAEPRTDGGA